MCVCGYYSFIRFLSFSRLRLTYTRLIAVAPTDIRAPRLPGAHYGRIPLKVNEKGYVENTTHGRFRGGPVNCGNGPRTDLGIDPR